MSKEQLHALAQYYDLDEVEAIELLDLDVLDVDAE